MTQNSSSIAITVSHLKKTYGNVKAVEDVSFAVNQGEIFGLLGPNGAGKTTTVECVTGLRRPDGGTISVLGLDRSRRSRFRPCAPEESPGVSIGLSTDRYFFVRRRTLHRGVCQE